MHFVSRGRAPLRLAAGLGALLVGSSAFPGESSAPEAPATVPFERPDLPFPPGVDPVSVCGPTDELQDVELYDGSLGVTRAYVQNYESRAVQFRWVDEAEMRRRLPDHVLGNVAGERWCTGTLIGPSTVLTAGHCFDVNRGEVGWFTPSKVDASGTATHLPPSELAKLQTVIFNYQVNGQTKLTRPGQSFPVKQLIEHRKGGLDYAIVELGPNAANQMPAALGYQPAALAASLAATGKPIAIIQHPQGDPKKIEAGMVLSYQGAEIFYGDIDTYGGSSGSGILDQNGNVLGVHTNGGCHAAGGANKGFQIQAIKAASDVLP